MLLRMLCRLWNCRPVAGREPAAEASPPRSAGGETPPEDLRALLDIPGVGPKTVQYLAQAGYTTLAQVRAASEAELAAIDGVGPRAAAALRSALSA